MQMLLLPPLERITQTTTTITTANADCPVPDLASWFNRRAIGHSEGSQPARAPHRQPGLVFQFAGISMLSQVTLAQASASASAIIKAIDTQIDTHSYLRLLTCAHLCAYPSPARPTWRSAGANDALFLFFIRVAATQWEHHHQRTMRRLAVACHQSCTSVTDTVNLVQCQPHTHTFTICALTPAGAQFTPTTSAAGSAGWCVCGASTYINTSSMTVPLILSWQHKLFVNCGQRLA